MSLNYRGYQVLPQLLHTGTHICLCFSPQWEEKRNTFIQTTLSYLVVIISVSLSSTGDLLWGCTQFTSSVFVACVTPCLGCNLLSSCYCYSRLWRSALLFPAAAVLWLVSISAVLTGLHFIALFNHSHKWTSVHIFILFKIPVPLKKSLSPRCMLLATFYTPTPFWLQQSSSLIVPVLTQSCLTESLFPKFSNPSTHLGAGMTAAIKLISTKWEVVIPSARDEWKLYRKLIYQNEEENEELELCI